MIEQARIKELNDTPEREEGKYILYWMQASQRHIHNHALEHAIDLANERELPVAVVFGLTANYPEANLRHYQFMIEGLREVRQDLDNRGIPFYMYEGSPDQVAIEAAEEARIIVADRGYLRHQKEWREKVANEAGCLVVQVESDVLVPVETASDKEEYAARTIRPKIHKQIKEFLTPLGKRKVKKPSKGINLEKGLDLDDEQLLDRFDLDTSVGPVSTFKGGYSEASARLKEFIKNRLQNYAEERNDIAEENTTTLSPYLHFGQISPVDALLQVLKEGNRTNENVEALLEEMIVRRELAINFVHFNPDYDAYKALPEWAQETLEKHREDEREYLYTFDEFEKGKTHDPYWNASMNEMKKRGTMKGYMRMYWGKKILEWSPSPEKAFDTTLALNNKYFLDGRDPNSYANVAWIFGKHDRPWQQRKVYGTIRYMNANGLKRKFDVESYIDWVDNLEK